MKILHISAHLGGGVGSFLSEVIKQECDNKDYFHDIVLLEKPKKSVFADKCKQYNAKIYICSSKDELKELIGEYDIVVLHWWHHPLTEKLLADFVDSKMRLLIWFHVNGCNYPYIPYKLCEQAHYLAFTTPYVYDNPFWTQSEKQIIKEKSSVIYGMGDISIEPHCKIHTDKKEFTIGYVGTLAKSKINPHFAEFCAKTLQQIPSARFVMLGDKIDCDILQEKLKALDILDFFEFVGYTNNVSDYLLSFDAFGYPLNPLHFGATENTILEAMSVGLPVVLLNQNTEKYIITNMHDGILVDDAEQYARAMKNLYENEELRSKLGENARQTIAKKFNIKDNILKMHNALDYVLKQDVNRFDFTEFFGDTAFSRMISCAGEDKEMFLKAANADEENAKQILLGCKDIYLGANKSSPFHFLKNNEDDPCLAKICNALKEEYFKIDFINQDINFWNDYESKIDIKSDVLLYGAGAMGKAAAIMLKNAGVNIVNIIDKSDTARNTFINEVMVINPSDITLQQKESCVFLVSMCAVPFFEIKDYLNSLGAKAVFPVGDFLQKINSKFVITNVWNFEDLNEFDKEKIICNNASFCDDFSRQNYELASRWFSSRDEKMQDNNFKIKREKYFTQDICELLKPSDTFLDTAALSGDYIELIIDSTKNNYASIYSFVLNLDNFTQLTQKYKDNQKLKFFDCEAGEISGDFSITRAGLMAPYISLAPQQISQEQIDVKMKDIPYNFLRAYSMSPILPIIRGGINTIKNYRPMIATNIGHFRDDFINVIPYLKKELINYDFYFRIHSYQGNDCILYAIPKERVK